MIEQKTAAAKERKSRDPLPLPADAPLLSLEDVAAFLRTTRAAVVRMVDGRMGDGKPDAIGAELRRWVVWLSPKRRLIRKKPFLDWLSSISEKPEQIS